jgi:hypothetical protein
MSSIDVETLDDEHEQRRDFRRANGAPLVSDPEDPDKTLRYSRPSSYAKCLDDEEALTNWRIWKAMEGVARSPALQIQVNATRDEDKVEKNELRNRALDKGTANERADQGTGLHAMTVRWEDQTDTDFDPPDEYQADLITYTNALETFGLVSEMFEVPFVNDEYRAAGTADRVYRLTKALRTPDGDLLEGGTLVIGDLKTGKKLDFGMPNYAAQLAIYAAGKLYDIHAERRLPTPPINQSWAILVHLPVGKAHCEVLWCSIEVGTYGAWLAREVKEWRRKWKSGNYDMPAVLEPAPLDPLQQVAEAFPDSTIVTLEQMAAFCQARISTIGANPKAKDSLILWWPSGLPTPKKGITDPKDMATLLKLLDRVEAEYSIPFTHTDPRNVLHEGKHRSKIDRSTEFALSGPS